jgi:Putative MetA-pathway of phenol degradation
VSANRQQKDDFIKPSRPTVSEPADIQRVGVLQLEFGLDAEFDAKEFRNQQTTPLELRFAALSRLLLSFLLETVKSQVDPTDGRMTGVGDAIIGLQVVAFKRTGYPTFAFAYHPKLPTASKEKNLGNGRVDHKAVLLIDDKLGGIGLSVNAAYLNVGRKDSGRRADGGLFAIAISHRFENQFGLFGELSGQSLEYSLPRGVYPLGGVTYRVNPRLRFDAGLRFGIGAEAPRMSVVAGVVFGIADLY